MTDDARPHLPPQAPDAPSAPPPRAAALDPKSMALGVYALYLANFLTGVSAVAGVIIAYVVRNDAEDWLKSHYEFQIRTFWLALAGVIAGFALIPIFGLGLLVLVGVALWFLIRSVMGLSLILKNEPYPNPKTWMI